MSRGRISPAALLGASAAVALAPGIPAAAHGLAPPPADLWAAWTADPYVLLPLLIAHWLYGRGVFRLWRRAGRLPLALSGTHVAYFVAGEVVLLLALVSPLEELAGALLSAHMAQHLLLMTVAPLLLIAGRPEIAFAWALPRSWVESIAVGSGWRLPRRAFRAGLRPVPAVLLHGAALWAWHAPAAYEAALRSPALHALEHAMFLATALMLWRSITGAAHAAGPAAAAMLATLVTLIHSGFLGALLTFAPRPLYGSYGAGLPAFGMTALGDQQLAGLLMWVPAGLLYLAAVLLLGRRLLTGDEADAAAAAGLARHLAGGTPSERVRAPSASRARNR